MGCKSTCDSMENAAMPSAERDARRQVRRLKGFYRHLTVFLMVGTVMLVLSLLAAPHGRWLPWPLLAWGVGLLFHAAATFSHGRWLGRDWEERKLRDLMGSKG